MIEFKEFPKMARLSRDVTITEKIDGTNASIFIQNEALEEGEDPNIVARKDGFTMRVGSRTRWITPSNDNYGFANWVKNNSDCLFELGEGLHFGEWWGSGIQIGYNLPKGEKRFSLFNTHRWSENRPACCHVVPVLYQGPFDTTTIDAVLAELVHGGSRASLGFMKPEGIIVWHTAANIGFKKTIFKDELPKSLAHADKNSNVSNSL